MRRFFINLKYFIEFIFVRLLFFVAYILPINITSKFGAIIFRLFGRLSKSHITAIQNCRHVFPNLTKKEVKKIVLKSWENLGQTIFELGILKKIFTNSNYIQTEGLNHIKEIIKNKRPAIFFSIHHSNWEICVPLLDRLGINVGAIYRHINNHYIDNFVHEQRARSLQTNISFYTPKGKKSAKDILETVKNKNSIFLLVDQKDSAGENIILFNKAIKTQTGFLKIARKYNMPLVPMENKRLKNGKFKITFHNPIFYNDSHTSDADMMYKIHNIIEKWILSNPTQWFWQHNRFN